MSDKQVIMSKKEFDQMEKDLSNLRKVVESKSIITIKTPHLGWNGAYTYTDSYFIEIEYVFGTEENEVIKELSGEIVKLKDTNKTLNQTIDSLEGNLRWFQNQQDDWKNLPWYKRLFV